MNREDMTDEELYNLSNGAFGIENEMLEFANDCNNIVGKRVDFDTSSIAVGWQPKKEETE